MKTNVGMSIKKMIIRDDTLDLVVISRHLFLPLCEHQKRYEAITANLYGVCESRCRKTTDRGRSDHLVHRNISSSGESDPAFFQFETHMKSDSSNRAIAVHVDRPERVMAELIKIVDSVTMILSDLPQILGTRRPVRHPDSRLLIASSVLRIKRLSLGAIMLLQQYKEQESN